MESILKLLDLDLHGLEASASQKLKINKRSLVFWAMLNPVIYNLYNFYT